MATRSILAMKDGDDILGVPHRYDGHPWNLGNDLLNALLDRGGDLAGAVREWIRDAPGGWIDVREQRRGDETPAFYRKADLAGQGWIEFTYLFDVDRRSLQVWEGNPELDARWGTPDKTVTIGSDGSAHPPVFEQPLELWHQLRVDPGWEADSPDSAEQRTRFVAELRARAADVNAFANEVAQAVAEAIGELSWSEPESIESRSERRLRERIGLPRLPVRASGDESLRVQFFASEGDRYWSVRVGSHLLSFPSAGCFRQAFDPLLLTRGDHRTATLELELLPEELLAPLMEAAAAASRPGDWLFQDGQLFRFVQVVADAAVADDNREIGLTQAREIDPNIDPGDELGISDHVPPLQWLLLEWLRLSQVPMPG